MTEHQQLQALLRLKRYEQPPSGYYEKLLRDVHRRQRSELLRRPLWSIAVERIQTFFGEHSMGSVSYAGAMAAVAFTGLLAIQMTGAPIDSASAVASTEAADLQPGTPLAVAPLAAVAPVAAVAAVDLAAIHPAPVQVLSLEPTKTDISTPQLEEFPRDARLLPARASTSLVKVRQPRYVIDSRPVSYEAANVSFSF